MAKRKRKPKYYPQHPLHPANWGQGLLIGLMWAVGHLPWRFACRLGEGLGWLGYWLAPGRRRIARRNLEVCFPEWSSDAREQVVRRNFMYSGRGIMEIALGWYGGSGIDRIPCTFQGEEHLHAAREDGRPIIFLSAHFLCVELAARLLGNRVNVAAIYKPMTKKPVLDNAMRSARLRNVAGALPRDDIRGIVRTARRGTAVWYAGDQDYGLRHSVFAPFFGHPAATINALSRLTRMAGAQVIPLFFNVKEDGSGYEIRFEPPLDDFPTGDEVQDATCMNQLVEGAIRRHPAQYLWIHRRFKRVPEPGQPNIYGETERVSKWYRHRAGR